MNVPFSCYRRYVDINLCRVFDLQQVCATVVLGRQKCSLVAQYKFQIAQQIGALAAVFELNAAVDLNLDSAEESPMSAHGRQPELECADISFWAENVLYVN
jgi:hypothetical protein